MSRSRLFMLYSTRSYCHTYHHSVNAPCGTQFMTYFDLHGAHGGVLG